MTSTDEFGSARPGTGAHPAIAAGLSELRRRADERWVEVANDVLDQAIRATRHSKPIQAHVDDVDLRLSEQVLITYLGRRIDGVVRSAAVGEILLNVDRDDELQAVTIEMFAQFGTPLMALSDEVRAIAKTVLNELLGAHPPDITVTPVHVHFGGVTRGDPHVEDPWDG